MSYYDDAKRDTEQLLKLVRESATYCTTISIRPELATDHSHQTEIEREKKIVELKTRLGVNC